MTSVYPPARMTWAEGHPEHWRDTIEGMGHSRPPELHEVELGGCKWCGRHNH